MTDFTKSVEWLTRSVVNALELRVQVRKKVVGESSNLFYMCKNEIDWCPLKQKATASPKTQFEAERLWHSSV